MDGNLGAGTVTESMLRSPHGQDAPAVSDELLVGAKAIAKELGWRRADGAWNVRRVYHVFEKGGLPIEKRPGIGLCILRSTLWVSLKCGNQAVKNI